MSSPAGRGVPDDPPSSHWPRRFGAIAVDWGASYLVAATLLPGDPAVVTLLVFATEQVLLVGTLGHALGHRLFGLTVRSASGGTVGPLRALVRTALVLLVLPPLVVGDDGRGLHDRAAGTRIGRIPAR